MVEAMFDKSPEYFKQFNKTFKFFTHPTLPDELLQFSNYAYGFHKEGTADYCNSGNHYHILVETDQKLTLPFELHSVPCLYTCFKYLINCTEKRSLKGEIVTKLQNAVLFNKTNEYDKTTPSALKKRLPLFQRSAMQTSLKRKHCETQTDEVPTALMSRFNRVLEGPNALNLLLILDILDSGYGCLQRNSQNSSLNFCLNTNNS